jgi:hypothetical protein
VNAARTPRLPDFVIGGTEKAGTTSVFNWLSGHPEVGASARKETDFFREQFTGDAALDVQRYGAHFEHASPHARVLMEASPGYLGEASVVAPRMRSLLPAARLLFILRDPIDRLYSSYHFHRGRLNLPQELGFDDYVRRCLAYDRGAGTPQALGLDEWYLKVLRFGCYADLLAVYRAHLAPERIKVMFFEDLSADPRGFMQELSRFLAIDASHWTHFDFRPSNVTFSARMRGLHRLAVRTNALAEPLMRRYPAVKQSLVRVYKAFNQEREGYDPMPAATRELLDDYYAPSLQRLEQLIDRPLPQAWRRVAQRRVAA